MFDLSRKICRVLTPATIRGRSRWIPARAVTGDGLPPEEAAPEPRQPVDSVLPVSPAAAGTPDVVPQPAPLRAQDEPRVLVVDDEDRVRRVCTLALRGEGYAAQGEGSALAALDRLRAGEPCDVLVLDYFMPELDGLALLRGLDDAGVARPAVLMTSAHADGAVALQALGLGVWDFISKPLTPVDLRRSVQRLLQRPRLAVTGDRRAQVMQALVDRRWDDADRLLAAYGDPLLHGLLCQVRGDDERAAAHFARAHWWTGWSKQGSEIWTELARRLDV